MKDQFPQAQRLPDWEDRLVAFLTVHTDRPFAWGQWDCALYATACAAAITGEDRAAEYRGTYSTREGSAKALRELGKGTLIRTMDSLFDRKPMGMAQRGDLVWAENAVGVCIGAVAMFVGAEGSHEGLVSIPRGSWQKAWAV